MSLRIAKINELVKSHLGEILTRELSLKPGVFITISKVDTSPDLRYTRVFVSIFPDSEIHYVEQTLKKEMNTIQGNLNKKLVMKPLPKVVFKTDLTESKADVIEKLLREL